MKKIFSSIIPVIIIFSFFPLAAQDLSISGGNDYSMSVCQDGKILVWGNILDANGNTIKSSVPVQVQASLPDITFTQADAGSGYHLLAVDCDKKVWAWGRNSHGQLGSRSTVANSKRQLLPVAGIGGTGQLANAIYVSGANLSSYALLSNGRLVSWGDNSRQQLGRSTTGSTDYIPNYVLTAANTPLENVIQVDAGDETVYALTADGKVYSWGDNLNFALGRGGIENFTDPYAKLVLTAPNTPLENIRSISGGDRHGLARDKNGNAWSWGGNWANQLGRNTNGANSAYADLVTGIGGVDILKNVREIAAGQASSMILINNEGNIVTFGANCLFETGQIPGTGGVLGRGNTECTSTLLPGYVKDCNNNNLRNIVQISDGDAVTYAVSGDGSLFVMGNNLNGELGLNDNVSRGCATRMPLSNYSCDIVEPCPRPDLGADIPVCNTSQLANVLLTARYSRNYVYKWYFRLNANANFTQISTADTNIYKPSRLGQYMVEVQRSYNNCSTCGIGYDTINVDLPTPLFGLNNGIFCKENSLTFSVSGSGQFNWYTTQSGGTLNTSFANRDSITVPISSLTPVLEGIDTVYNMYVEDVSIRKGTLLSTNGNVGGNGYNVNAAQNDPDALAKKSMYFNVFQTVKLDSVALKLYNYTGSPQNYTVSLTLYDNAGNVVISRPNIALNNVPGGTPVSGMYWVAIGSPNLVAANGYRLAVTGGNAEIAFFENPTSLVLPAVSAGDLQGYVTLRGPNLNWADRPNAIPGIVNWKFSAQGGYPCGRARVTMTKDCPCNKPALTITSTTGQTAFCSNLNQSLILKANPTPGTPAIEPFGYVYQWYRNGSPISSRTRDTLFLRSSGAPATYTVRVGHSSLVRTKCYTELTQNITVQPRITGNNIISRNDTVCSGTAAKLIEGSTPAGGTGTISYVWLRSSRANGGYTAIASSNTKDYNPGVLNSSTYFRRLVLRGVCSDTSAPVRVFVDPTITDPGVFAGPNPVVCSGSRIPSLAFSTPTGGTAPLKYQWESSLNQTNWTTMSQETSATLRNLPVLTQRTYFRRRVMSVECTAISGAVLIGVDTSVTSNSFTSNVTQQICENTRPGRILGSTPTGGVRPYTYKWQQSNSINGPFTDIPNSNTKDYTPPVLTTTTYFKRVVTSTGACANSVSSQTATVTVDPLITAGNIQPAQPLICAGTSPVLLNQTSPTGGTMPYTYKWQMLNGTTWTDIPSSNASSSELREGPSIENETQFRRIVISAIQCQATSPAVTVRTTGQMRPGEIRVTDTSVCAGRIPGIIQNVTVATGGTGTSGIQYQWERSLNGTNWTVIAGENNLTLAPGALAANTYFRRKASNGTGVCDEVYAGPVLIKQYLKLNPGTLQSSDTSVCDGTGAVVRSVDLPSNGSPAKTYSWVIAYSPGFVYKDTAVNTSSLSLSNLTRTVKVKRIVRDACETDTSVNDVTVTVFPKDIVDISITTDLSRTICSDQPLEVRASVKKAGARTISWEYDGQSITTNPDSILIIPVPKNGAKIRVTSVTDPRLICTTPLASTQEITLSINDPITNNTFTASEQRLCLGSDINPIQGGTVTGGVQPTTYQWLVSENETGPFTPVTGAAGSTYTPNVTKTTFYKRVVTSSGVCKADTSSDLFTVFVDQPVVPGAYSLIDSTLCKGDSLRFNNTTPASGGTITLNYNWEVSLSLDGPWNVLPNQIGNSMVFPKSGLDSLRNTFYFRRRASSEICNNATTAFQTVICQKPHVTNFDLNKTCAHINTPFNILDTIIDIEKGKGDFSTNGWRLRVDSVLKVSANVESYTFNAGTPGSFIYRSKENFIGRDTVVFKVCEEVAVNALCVTKAYYFNVLPVNRPPVVKNELYSTYKNQLIADANVLENDSDPDGDTLYVWPSYDKTYLRDSLILPYKKYTDSVLRMPSNGVLRMTYDGRLNYQPNEDYIGPDTAVFYVCDFTSSREYCTVDPFFCQRDTIVFDVKPYRIFIPDGFSPNGDGTNDFFVIRSEVPLEIDIKLYNRWGNLVYEKEGYQNDFDGRANKGLVIGNGLPDGTYYLHYDVHDKLVNPNPGFKYITISR